MVVLFHYTTRYNQIYGHTVPIVMFDIGRYGVHLFFMISGFVIFLTINRIKKIEDFIISRFSRLYPAYWVAIMITFFSIQVFSLPGRETSLSDLVINFTMLQEWFRVPHVDGVYWTLTVELSFYILMSLLFLTRLLKYVDIVSLIWLCLVIITKWLKMYLGVTLPNLIKLLLLLDHGNLFIAGMMFFKFKNTKKIKYIGIILLSLLVSYYLYPENKTIFTIYFLIFFLFSMDYLKFIAIRSLVFLGSISYSLYLIHQNIGYIIIRFLYRLHLASWWSVPIVPATISIGIACWMYHFIEKPSLSFIRKKYAEVKDRI